MNLELIKQFAERHITGEIANIIPLQQAGSDRIYYRIETNNQSYICCYSLHIAESKQFINFTNHFKEIGILVPNVIATNEDCSMYLLDDLGPTCLLDIVLQEGESNRVRSLYQQCIIQLVELQMQAKVDFDETLASTSFDKTQILADLNYFKYYFLDLQKISYNKVALTKEFDNLSSALASISPTQFMYRDFQARNIMVKNDEVYFIDYQGGMQGPSQYDVASLLWQAKANFSSTFKNEMLDFYINTYAKHKEIDENKCREDFSKLVLIRLLQVLGAYGLRGTIEGKKHFLTSIPQGLENIGTWMQLYTLQEYPCILSILHTLSSNTFKQKFMIVEKVEKEGLEIKVQSFSYKKGMPVDNTDNGGGFVFDCRGILNPGRFEEHKKQTGRDKPVMDFLEQKTKMPEFLETVKQLISISIDDYIARGFKNLMISFGCTGGQHRSVYSTDAIAAFIKEKYKLEPTVYHIEQEKKNWIN
jgi:aminoglycoside/choline kinase family phosphotransferase